MGSSASPTLALTAVCPVTPGADRRVEEDNGLFVEYDKQRS